MEGGLSGRRGVLLGLRFAWRLVLIGSFLFAHELIIYFILSIMDIILMDIFIWYGIVEVI